MINNLKFCELDSFYESNFFLFTGQKSNNEISELLTFSGFKHIQQHTVRETFCEKICAGHFDIVIVDYVDASITEDLITFRKSNSDAALIVLSDDDLEAMNQLTLNVDALIRKPVAPDNLIKAVKRALGTKNNFEIGMQFFDALFGMQMCTHRDLHQRTFEHAIRTTQVFGKFLLFLMEQNVIKLTSWTLKNCLMASLVHDIGKLLVMHGILYKEGRLTELEYQQVKRHPWHSVTALLGGQDIEFFAEEGPLETVSGYNEKNLSEMTKRWIFKVLEDDASAYSDLDQFFHSLYRKPFIHSLNKDLLYIVFRHHDGLDISYHEPEDLNLFAKVIDRPLSQTLSLDSYLDVVTNALSLCDFYDALLDKKRDYRKKPFNKSFTLYFAYLETRNRRFFPVLTEQFIKFIVQNEITPEENLFCADNNPVSTFAAIKKIDELFRIAPGQEYEFNQFLIEMSDKIQVYTKVFDESLLLQLNEEWGEFYSEKHKIFVEQFYSQLKEANLVAKPITKFTIDEVKVFDMLFNFYYSYSSSLKQKKLIDYLVETVIERKIDSETKDRLVELIQSEKFETVRDIKKVFVEKGYARRNIFEVFKHYNEELLLTEFNQGL